MALNLDNERRYLNSLLESGNSGQQTWAKNRAKQIGVTLGGTTKPTTTTRPKTPSASPTVTGTHNTSTGRTTNGRISSTTTGSIGASGGGRSTGSSGSSRPISNHRPGSLANTLANNNGHAQQQSGMLVRSNSKPNSPLVHASNEYGRTVNPLLGVMQGRQGHIQNAIQSGNWQNYWNFESEQAPMHFEKDANGNATRNKTYYGNLIESRMKALKEAQMSGDQKQIDHWQNAVNMTIADFKNAPGVTPHVIGLNNNKNLAQQYGVEAPSSDWYNSDRNNPLVMTNGITQRRHWSHNPHFEKNPDELKGILESNARRGVGGNVNRPENLPSWYTGGGSPQGQPSFGMPGQLSPGQGQPPQGQAPSAPPVAPPQGGGGQYNPSDPVIGDILNKIRSTPGANQKIGLDDFMLDQTRRARESTQNPGGQPNFTLPGFISSGAQPWGGAIPMMPSNPGNLSTSIQKLLLTNRGSEDKGDAKEVAPRGYGDGIHLFGTPEEQAKMAKSAKGRKETAEKRKQEYINQQQALARFLQNPWDRPWGGMM